MAHSIKISADGLRGKKGPVIVTALNNLLEVTDNNLSEYQAIKCTATSHKENFACVEFKSLDAVERALDVLSERYELFPGVHIQSQRRNQAVRQTPSVLSKQMEQIKQVSPAVKCTEGTASAELRKIATSQDAPDAIRVLRLQTYADQHAGEPVDEEFEDEVEGEGGVDHWRHNRIALGAAIGIQTNRPNDYQDRIAQYINVFPWISRDVAEHSLEQAHWDLTAAILQETTNYGTEIGAAMVTTHPTPVTALRGGAADASAAIAFTTSTSNARLATAAVAPLITTSMAADQRYSGFAADGNRHHHDRAAVINQYMDVMGCTEEEARASLQLTDWDLDMAVQISTDTPTDTPTDATAAIVTTRITGAAAEAEGILNSLTTTVDHWVQQLAESSRAVFMNFQALYGVGSTALVAQTLMSIIDLETTGRITGEERSQLETDLLQHGNLEAVNRLVTAWFNQCPPVPVCDSRLLQPKGLPISWISGPGSAGAPLESSSSDHLLSSQDAEYKLSVQQELKARAVKDQAERQAAAIAEQRHRMLELGRLYRLHMYHDLHSRLAPCLQGGVKGCVRIKFAINASDSITTPSKSVVAHLDPDSPTHVLVNIVTMVLLEPWARSQGDVNEIDSLERVLVQAENESLNPVTLRGLGFTLSISHTHLKVVGVGCRVVPSDLSFEAVSNTDANDCGDRPKKLRRLEEDEIMLRSVDTAFACQLNSSCSSIGDDSSWSLSKGSSSSDSGSSCSSSCGSSSSSSSSSSIRRYDNHSRSAIAAAAAAAACTWSYRSSASPQHRQGDWYGGHTLREVGLGGGGIVVVEAAEDFYSEDINREKGDH